MRPRAGDSAKATIGADSSTSTANNRIIESPTTRVSKTATANQQDSFAAERLILQHRIVRQRYLPRSGCLSKPRVARLRELPWVRRRPFSSTAKRNAVNDFLGWNSRHPRVWRL